MNLIMQKVIGDAAWKFFKQQQQSTYGVYGDDSPFYFVSVAFSILQNLNAQYT